MTSVGPSTVTTTLVEINKLRNALLKLVDHYDAVAAELRRQNIPVKDSWETHKAVAKARLDRLVSLHERANHEQLSLKLGESKLSAADSAECAEVAAEPGWSTGLYAVSRAGGRSRRRSSAAAAAAAAGAASIASMSVLRSSMSVDSNAAKESTSV